MDYGLRIMLGGGIMVWIVPAILIGIIVLSIFKIASKDIKVKFINLRFYINCII